MTSPSRLSSTSLSYSSATVPAIGSLHNLPLELRNAIYALVLAVELPPIFTYRAHKRQPRVVVVAPPQPALSLTCRQIRDEALAIYFKTIVIERKNVWLPIRNGDTLGTNPAPLPAMKYARSVEFAARVQVHSDVYAHPNERLHVHSRVNTQIAKLRVCQTDLGVTLDLAIADRCRCDLDKTIKKFNVEASSLAESFGDVIAWADGKVQAVSKLAGLQGLWRTQAATGALGE